MSYKENLVVFIKLTLPNKVEFGHVLYYVILCCIIFVWFINNSLMTLKQADSQIHRVQINGTNQKKKMRQCLRGLVECFYSHTDFLAKKTKVLLAETHSEFARIT